MKKSIAKGTLHFEMRDFLKTALLVTNIISGVFTFLFGGLGVLAEILNPPTFEKLLSKLNIPITYDRLLLAAYINLAVLIITYLLREEVLCGMIFVPRVVVR
ncbi:MAG: hypothetical protein ACLRR6_04985 [Oscillospiraceae bacterium]